MVTLRDCVIRTASDDTIDSKFIFKSEAVVLLFTFYVWTWTSKASKNRTVTHMNSEMSENAINMNCYKFSLHAAFSFPHSLSVTHSLSFALPRRIEYCDYSNYRRQEHCNKNFSTGIAVLASCVEVSSFDDKNVVPYSCCNLCNNSTGDCDERLFNVKSHLELRIYAIHKERWTKLTTGTFSSIRMIHSQRFIAFRIELCTQLSAFWSTLDVLE